MSRQNAGKGSRQECDLVTMKYPQEIKDLGQDFENNFLESMSEKLEKYKDQFFRECILCFIYRHDIRLNDPNRFDYQKGMGIYSNYVEIDLGDLIKDINNKDIIYPSDEATKEIENIFNFNSKLLKLDLKSTRIKNYEKVDNHSNTQNPSVNVNMNNQDKFASNSLQRTN